MALLTFKRVKGLNKAEVAMARRLNKFIQNRTLLKQIGDIALKAVVGNLKNGKTMASGQLKKLKPLSAAWIKERKRLADLNRTSPVYSPSRSNVSFTGQLLDAFEIDLRRSKQGIVRIDVDDDRQPYVISRRGTKAKNTPSNDDLIDFLRKGKRDILGKLDEKTQRRIRQHVVRELRRRI